MVNRSTRQDMCPDSNLNCKYIYIYIYIYTHTHTCTYTYNVPKNNSLTVYHQNIRGLANKTMNS